MQTAPIQNTPLSSAQYPLLIAAYKLVHKTSTNGNIARILINDSGESPKWKWSENVRIYEQAKDATAVCAGRLKVGDGIFVLYKVQSETCLMFTTTDEDDYGSYVIALNVPPSEFSIVWHDTSQRSDASTPTRGKHTKHRHLHQSRQGQAWNITRAYQSGACR